MASTVTNFDVLIVGGGAAGFFTAVNLAEKNPKLKIAILERGKEVLTKVRISGGGRCNVTHACFVPNDLVKFYPRGEKELRSPFHQFCSGDTIAWFEQRGVPLKIEDDGRMFPTSDNSQTIIDCFLEAAQKHNVTVLTSQSVQSIYKHELLWKLETQNEQYTCEKLVITTGSNPKMWDLLQKLGHKIVPAVPSLFTFNSKDARLKNLMGIAAFANVQVLKTKLSASGPVLITHWGLSGPGILRLSAWGALDLAAMNYQFQIKINWLEQHTREEVVAFLKSVKVAQPKKVICKKAPFEASNDDFAQVRLPNRLWEQLVLAAEIDAETKWADLNKQQLNNLVNQLTEGIYQMQGKSTYKDEFVTAGGIDLKEINFKTMQSKIFDSLFFAGEVMNVDAITGGFNFQNAWTSGWIVSENI
jgi:predicted Rossmann fold flavoprotein